MPDFGFPKCHGQGGSACAGTEPPLVSLKAHATPTGVAVKGDTAYLAENGSALADKEVGRDILRVDLRTGRHERFWRSPVSFDPAGLAVGADGDLYLALFASGKVMRFDL